MHIRNQGWRITLRIRVRTIRKDVAMLNWSQLWRDIELLLDHLAN